MCGITGYINFNQEPSSPHIIKNMTDIIEHRGPDGEGQWVEQNVAIGHRRLAIIDLSPAGNQPMISQDHRYVLSYNGEIYNFNQLRTKLEAKGYLFRSNTDSEVVLYSYAEWGKDCVKKFNGMFAFAIWDRKEKQLFLARDRYGIKPLYYGIFDNTFIFASETKSILQHPSAKNKLNNKALMEYFTFQNIFTENTLIDGVKILPAGHTAEIKKDLSSISLNQYWDFHFSQPIKKIDKREYIEELDRLLNQALNRQLITDVEIGSYLSGGMDSGTLTALASKQLPFLKTFTCGFDLSSASGMELTYDERFKAEAMSALYKTEHYEMVLKSGDMERCLQKFSWHLEEPRVGQSYPNYYVAGLASKFVKVILSGAGGDELFAGYPWRYYRTLDNKNFDDYIAKYYLFWQRLIPNKDIKNVFSPIWESVKDVWTLDIFKNVFKNHKNELDTATDYINHSLYFEAKTFLHGLLVVEDKLSMAHSLETRVPFLDNDLVDFAMKCPVELKLNNLKEVIRMNENETGNKETKYYSKTNDGKQLLRDVMTKYVPNEISKGIKQGFSSPDASWFKGESIEFVKKLISNKNSKIYKFFDTKSVLSLANDHFSGKENRRLLIWSLLNFENYLNNFSE